MRGAIESLAFNLPLAIIIFVPIYFFTRKQLEQRFQWGILILLWVILAFVNPHHSPGTTANSPEPTTQDQPAQNQPSPATPEINPVSAQSQAAAPSPTDVCNEVLENLKRAKSEIDKYYEINRDAPPSLDNTNFKTTYGVEINYGKFGSSSKYLGPSFSLSATHPGCNKQYRIDPGDTSTIKVQNKL
jgi:hypothetical protein